MESPIERARVELAEAAQTEADESALILVDDNKAAKARRAHRSNRQLAFVAVEGNLNTEASMYPVAQNFGRSRKG